MWADPTAYNRSLDPHKHVGGDAAVEAFHGQAHQHGPPLSLRLMWPEWLRPSADALHNSEGVACVLGNVLVYTLAILMLGAGLAVLPLHLRRAGSTTLGAYLVQFFVAWVPFLPEWRALVSPYFLIGSPFEGLDQLAFTYCFVLCVAGPLMQRWLIVSASRHLAQCSNLRRHAAKRGQDTDSIHGLLTLLTRVPLHATQAPQLSAVARGTHRVEQMLTALRASLHENQAYGRLRAATLRWLGYGAAWRRLFGASASQRGPDGRVGPVAEDTPLVHNGLW